MKACKVLEKLEVTRKTLNNYVKFGKIRVRKLNNGFYDYDEDDVAKLMKDVVYRNKITIYIGKDIHEFSCSEEQACELLQMTIKYFQDRKL